MSKAVPLDQLREQLIEILEAFFDDDARRIAHAKQVLDEAEKLALDQPGLDMELLLASVILHDVGIKPSEEKYGYNNGKTQEELGPAVAEELLKTTCLPQEKVAKVKEIIGNHHSPSRYQYPELQVLKTADSIVNRYGD